MIIIFLYVPRKRKQKPRFGMYHADDDTKAAGFQRSPNEGSDRIAASPRLTVDLNKATLPKEPSIEAGQEEFWPSAEKLAYSILALVLQRVRDGRDQQSMLCFKAVPAL